MTAVPPCIVRVVPIGTDNPWEQRTTKKGAAGGSDVSRGRAKVVAAYPRLLNTCDNIRIALPKGGWLKTTYVNGRKGPRWTVNIQRPFPGEPKWVIEDTRPPNLFGTHRSNDRASWQHLRFLRFSKRLRFTLRKCLMRCSTPGWTTNTCNEATKTDRQRQTNRQNSMNEEARRQRPRSYGW